MIKTFSRKWIFNFSWRSSFKSPHDGSFLCVKRRDQLEHWLSNILAGISSFEGGSPVQINCPSTAKSFNDEPQVVGPEMVLAKAPVARHHVNVRQVVQEYIYIYICTNNI